MKKVLLVNWDSYPNNQSGGVYTWIKALINDMPDYEYVVINQLSNPNFTRDFVLPNNVTKTIEMPIFGCNRYEEFYDEKKSLIPKIHRTTEFVLKNEFLPLYRNFVRTVMSDTFDQNNLFDLVLKLHKFLIVYDSKKCFEHYLTWDTFLEEINNDNLYKNMTLKEVSTAFQVLQRNMEILAIEVPRVDVIHCSLAWTPSLVAVFAKDESKCPVIVTEHGVAYKELLLHYNVYMYDEPARVFWKIVTRNIIKAVYALADVITPVCEANGFWEKTLGVDPSKIQVVYNGVNIQKFKPIEVTRETDRPTIVCVTRIDKYKDLTCLIQSIKIVKEQVPNIQCLIYGTSVDLEYSLRCVKMVKDLSLDDNVIFMGGINEPEKAYNQGDIVVVTSIMEGLPYTLIEGMACGKAIVASNVGGIGEAMENCGLLVRSLRPFDLANAMVKLLMDRKLRDDLGKAAVKKVEKNFTLENTVNTFRQLYKNTIDSYQKNIILGPPIRGIVKR